MRFQSVKKIALMAPLFFGLFFGCKSTEEGEQDGVIVTEPVKEEQAVENLTLDVKTVYFDYDKSDVKEEFTTALGKVAEFLKKMPNATLELEGHCDSRGSNNYNLALGQRRVDAVKNYLGTLGVDASRLKTTTYGEERPVCKEETDDCHAKNRRVEIKVAA